MSIVSLSGRPSRQELREARKLLLPLVKCKIPGAAEDLLAVDGLVRAMFPRRTADSLSEPREQQQARRRGKQRRPIEERDCMGKCPTCEGRRGSRGALVCVFCVTCLGSGVGPVGKAEHAKAETLLRGTANRSKALRGDFAAKTGISTAPRSVPQTHRRGYMGGRVIGDRAAHGEEAVRWRGGNCDPADLSAALEAIARRRMKSDMNGLDYERGRRLVKKSGRDRGILTPRQEKRAKMSTRVRREQAIWNRAHRADENSLSRNRDMAAEARAVLERMGIDVDAAIAAMGIGSTPASDSPTLAEARRRGDLPPDDLLEAEFDPCMVRVLAGPHAGETGRYTVAILGASVVRSAGFVEHGARAARVEFGDGEFDIVHFEDVFPVAELIGGAA